MRTADIIWFALGILLLAISVFLVVAEGSPLAVLGTLLILFILSLRILHIR